jgi:hypothetical protein
MNFSDKSQGVFFTKSGKNLFSSTKNNCDLVITESTNINSKGIQILQVNVKNIGTADILLNSILVSEFLLKGQIPSEILENSWTQSGFSDYKKINEVTKRKRFFLTRDQNPYSFKNEFGYLKNSLVSEWYTQLVFKDYSMVIGAISIRNNFCQVYVREENGGVRVRITCQFDGLSLKPDESFESEKIAVISGSKDESLNKFADLVRKENHIKELQKPIRGLCCAYYFQGNKVDERYVLDQLKELDKTNERIFDVIQIDGIPTPWGDWIENWEKLFPNGLAFLANEIKKRDYRAGFWISPYVASPKSKLFNRHQDWFSKGDDGKCFEARFSSPVDFVAPLSLRALDPTHPDVQKYITKVIGKMVSYGFSYIKTDFTYPVCFAKSFYKNVTRVQALREGFEVIRKAAGKDVLIQSSITQLSPLVGLVDFVKTGLDTLNPFVCKVPIVNSFVNNYMLGENLRSSQSRNFFHDKIWIADPDCAVFRDGTGISKSLIEKHKEFALKNKTSRWCGDSISRMRPKEKQNMFIFFEDK